MQTQSHTIPGRKIEHSLGGHTAGLKKRADDAYMKHEDWVAFLDVFREVGVSILGEPIPDHVVIKMSKSNWPPKGWKKKR